VQRAGRKVEGSESSPEPDALIVVRARLDPDDMKAPACVYDGGIGFRRRRRQASAFDREKAAGQFRSEEAGRCMHGRDFELVAGELVERLRTPERAAQERESPISKRPRIDLGKPQARYGERGGEGRADGAFDDQRGTKEIREAPVIHAARSIRHGCVSILAQSCERTALAD